MDMLKSLYSVIEDRKKERAEGSYTCYLFEKGLDKILKKVGEESAETIIAAKNGQKDLIGEEVCDLLYHLLVMLSQLEVPIEDIERILGERAQKIGNLKQQKQTDRNT